VFYGRIARIA